jgi:hypothetical protein
VKVWLAVVRLWLVERAEKAAEAGREKHLGSVVHQNCFHPLPVERKDLESLRGKSRVTDSKVWHWQACEVDPCMASHAVYEVGYGRFLAIEEQHGAAFGADMASQVHAFLSDKSKGGLKASELLSPAMTTCITAAIALFKVRPALNLHSPILCTRLCTPPAVCEACSQYRRFFADFFPTPADYSPTSPSADPSLRTPSGICPDPSLGRLFQTSFLRPVREALSPPVPIWKSTPARLKMYAAVAGGGPSHLDALQPLSGWPSFGSAEAASSGIPSSAIFSDFTYVIFGPSVSATFCCSVQRSFF